MQIQFAQSVSGTATSLTTSYADFLTVPITTTGSSATVELSAVVGCSKSSTGNVYAQLLWDGVSEAVGTISLTGGYSGVVVVSCVLSGVAAGSHTAKVQCKMNTSGGSAGGTDQAASLIVKEH